MNLRAMSIEVTLNGEEAVGLLMLSQLGQAVVAPDADAKKAHAKLMRALAEAGVSQAVRDAVGSS